MTTTLKNIGFIFMLGGISMIYAMACQNPSASSSSKSNQSQTGENKLELNRGQKWQINPEMAPFIQAQEISLNSYLDMKDSNFIALAKSLHDSNQKLIKSCTMSGESHNQLHHWLHPHIQLIEALKNAETKEVSDTIIKQIQLSFKTYNQYFQ